jgi:hypothetical protein
MGYTVHENVFRLVIDSIKHPVVSNPETVTLFSLEFSSSKRAGIGLQGKDFFADTFMNFVGQAVHLFLRRPLDLNCIAHLVLPLPVFQVFSERARRFLSSLLNGSEIYKVMAEIRILN